MTGFSERVRLLLVRQCGGADIERVCERGQGPYAGQLATALKLDMAEYCSRQRRDISGGVEQQTLDAVAEAAAGPSAKGSLSALKKPTSPRPPRRN